MKRILLVEEDYLIIELQPIIESWGYEVIGISKGDFVEEAIKRHEINLIIIAKEMRISGESLTLSMREQPNLPLADHLLKLQNTNIDFAWGLRLSRELKTRGIELPVICITTDEFPKMVWYSKIEDVLYDAVIPKDIHFHANLEAVLNVLLRNG